jgi:hypothetical protein
MALQAHGLAARVAEDATGLLQGGELVVSYRAVAMEFTGEYWKPEFLARSPSAEHGAWLGDSR